MYKTDTEMQRHARILAEIAALEAGEAAGSLNEKAKQNLRTLRRELSELEPLAADGVDTTTLTLEQRRALISASGDYSDRTIYPKKKDPKKIL